MAMYGKITNFEITSDDEFEFDLTIPGSRGPELHNQFRKILYSQIPTYAITKIEIFINESNVIDELLIFKLNLIPLTLTETPKHFEPFLLGIDASDSERIVTSSDLICPNGDLIPIPDCQICRLSKGRKLALRCHVEKGIGAIHSGWTPVVVVSFQPVDQETYHFRVEITGHLQPYMLLNMALKKFNNSIIDDHTRI